MGAILSYAVAVAIALGIVASSIFIMSLAVGSLFWAVKRFKEMMY
jgi:hypothetical protein